MTPDEQLCNDLKKLHKVVKEIISFDATTDWDGMVEHIELLQFKANMLDCLIHGGMPLKAKYIKRDPDPGVCKLISIDWEDQKVSMTNGGTRYFPSFDEIEMVVITERPEDVS